MGTTSDCSISRVEISRLICVSCRQYRHVSVYKSIRNFQVKIQKMRSNLEEKLMKRMSTVHRKAEEWRAVAQLQHSEQIQKVTEQAQKMMNKKNINVSRANSCGCFPCNNHHM